MKRNVSLLRIFSMLWLHYVVFTVASYSIHHDLPNTEYCQVCLIKHFDPSAKFAKSPDSCARLEYEDGIVRKKFDVGDAYLITCHVSKEESRKIDPSAVIVVSGVLPLTISSESNQEQKYLISEYITDRHVSYDDAIVLTEEQVLQQVHPKLN